MRSLFPTSINFLVILLLIVSSCSDQEITPVTESTSIDEAAARKSAPLVSSFSYNNRLYEFTYDSEGRVTTISVSEGSIFYTYVAHYDGDQLISADLVEDGRVMSSNTNFEFDRKGRIIAYDYVSYFFPDIPEGLRTHYMLTYDKKGNLVTMFDNSTLVYDNHRNVIQWGDRIFTYERMSNPFYSIPDLWLIFVEETYYAELMISPNVNTSQTFPNGIVTTYQNEFDENGNLIRRVSLVNGSVIETLTFTY
jgi:YD repeat-containing protein